MFHYNKDVVLKYILLKGLYLLLHALYAIGETLMNVWYKCIDFNYELKIGHEQDYIIKNVVQLKKIPTHITVIFGSTLPDYKDLANLFQWCVWTNVGFVSFYNHKDSEELKTAICKIENNAKNISELYHEVLTSNNGQKIFVKALSVSDGWPSIVNATKQLMRSDEMHISEEIVDAYLKKSYVFPNPDLCLYYGEPLKLYAYPPWQLRLTEFISIKHHRDFSPCVFINILRKYNKIERRFGK